MQLENIRVYVSMTFFSDSRGIFVFSESNKNWVAAHPDWTLAGVTTYPKLKP